VIRRATVTATGLLLLGGGFPADAQARLRCSYVGSPANVLTVTASGDALGRIRRRGQEIVVREQLQERPGRCSGAVPTVLNTDTIRVLLRGGLADVELRLAGGPLAPGATPEAEGEPEIEVQFIGRFVLSSVVGTARADEFHWGRGGVHAGLNLNPGNAGDQDVDVTSRGEESILIAEGGAGSDTVVPALGAKVPDSGVFSIGGPGGDFLVAPRTTGGILLGGRGNDVLTGDRGIDDLDGGAGDDRVTGNGRADRIVGGRGRDLLAGGPGSDRINSRDSWRDLVRCGPGRDRVSADRKDGLRGCELARRQP
jgi:hypothetical protein